MICDSENDSALFFVSDMFKDAHPDTSELSEIHRIAGSAGPLHKTHCGWIVPEPDVYRNEKEMEDEMIANAAVTFRPLLCYFSLVLEMISKNPWETMKEMILCAYA